MNIDAILDLAPYGLAKSEKYTMLNSRLQELTFRHYSSCSSYKKMVDASGFSFEEPFEYEKLPPLPVRLFKELDLRSVSEEEVIKTMTSSGTTGQSVSKIFLDRTTSARQTKVLTRIVSEFIGKKRVPLILLDSGNVVKDRKMFSARGAGILGFSMFASKRIFALDDNMNLELEQLTAFIHEHKGETILLFGFTAIAWQHVFMQLKSKNIHLDLSNAILIHGGGWKKLSNEKVSPEDFKRTIHDLCNIKESNIHDYYGMVEQTGTIYMECSCGHLHASTFSDILIRRPSDFTLADVGERGLIEVLSVLPESYPGHALLTEDEGVILGEDDCPCGLKGKYFKIFGRLQNAEIRGCSDTYNAGGVTTGAVDYVVGDASTVEQMAYVPTMELFSENTVDFLNDLSKLLLRKGRAYSDVATFAFWCRRSALMKVRARMEEKAFRIGKGIVFHSTPSNVPVNFAFSFAASLLAGNASIVRLPAKDFPQVTLICEAMNELLSSSHTEIAPYISMVKFPQDKHITDHFSSMCDCRVIWGGDGTIQEIRRSPLKPRANEITFADRHSLVVIDSDRYLQEVDKETVARNFYNDTYFSDQNACTAPRVVVWLGHSIKEAKNSFWKNLETLVNEKYQLQPIQAVGKLTATYLASVGLSIQNVIQDDPKLTRLELNQLDENIMKFKYNSGFFFEYEASTLDEMLPLCDEKCQTMTYFGLPKEAIQAFIQRHKPRGVDRIVPIGQSMDFNLIWDGVDLIRALSRIVTAL